MKPGQPFSLPSLAPDDWAQISTKYHHQIYGLPYTSLDIGFIQIIRLNSTVNFFIKGVTIYSSKFVIIA